MYTSCSHTACIIIVINTGFIHTFSTISKLFSKGFIMEDVIFLIFGGWLDLTENERFLRKLFKIRNDQHYNTKLFCSQKVFPKPTICLIKHKIESENQIFGSRLLNRNMTTSIIKPLLMTRFFLSHLSLFDLSLELTLLFSSRYMNSNLW